MQLVQSYGVGSTLAAQRIVAITAANTVGYPSSVGVLPVGVTLDTVKDTTQAIPVAHNGIAKVYFNDTVAAAGLVASDSSGRGVPFTFAATSTAISAPACFVGVLLGAAVAATGTIADVLIIPGVDRVGA